MRCWGKRTDGGLVVENAKDTLCRNVTIYGHCRYEDKGAIHQLLGTIQADRVWKDVHSTTIQARRLRLQAQQRGSPMMKEYQPLERMLTVAF